MIQGGGVRGGSSWMTMPQATSVGHLHQRRGGPAEGRASAAAAQGGDPEGSTVVDVMGPPLPADLSLRGLFAVVPAPLDATLGTPTESTTTTSDVNDAMCEGTDPTRRLLDAVCAGVQSVVGVTRRSLAVYWLPPAPCSSDPLALQWA